MKPASTISLLFVTVTVACASGCLGSYGSDPSGSNDDAGVGPDGKPVGPQPDMAVDVKADFTAKVQPLLLADCGTCHSTVSGGVGPGFLSANPDVFTTVVSYPGLISTTCDTSRILTKDVHVGPSFHTTSTYTPPAPLPADQMVICDWIKEYNSAGGFGAATGADLSVKPTIPPFAPTAGMKCVDLGVLDPKFTGATLCFSISISSDNALITFSNITLTSTASTGIHIKSPLFARYAPADPKVAVDIDYDYLSKEFSIGPSQSVVFDPPLTITAYAAGQLVNVDFDTLESSTGAPDMAGTATATCKDLTAFNTFMPNLTAALPGMNNACSNGGCHGANGGVGGLNLNGIAAGNAAVCLSVLNNVILGNIPTSPLYLHPTDASTHAGGKITAANQAAYLTAVTTFANAQK